MDRVSIILPTYNEKGNILALITRIFAVLSQANILFEIVVIDDNSPDGTGQLAENFAKTHKEVHVYIRTKDRGLGNSILLGVQKTTGSIIVGMDADFNHDPTAIPTLVRNLDTAQLVVGSRFVKGGGMEEWYRLVPTFLFNIILKCIGFPVMDNMSGFYAIRRRDLLMLNPDAIYYGYGDYHMRLVYYAKRLGYCIQEVPVYYKKRLSGKSKSNLLKMTKDYVFEAIRLTTQS